MCVGCLCIVRSIYFLDSLNVTWNHLDSLGLSEMLTSNLNMFRVGALLLGLWLLLLDSCFVFVFLIF